MAASILTSSTAFICCEYAVPAAALYANRMNVMPLLCLMAATLALHPRDADLTALGLFHEIADEGNRHIGTQFDLRQAHLPEAIINSMLHGHDVRCGYAIGGPRADSLACLIRFGE